MIPPVVDAFVEMGHRDNVWTRVIDERYGLDKQPLSVPEAIERARAVWRSLNGWNYIETCELRVIDTAGVVVEQWPKQKS